MSEVAKKLNLEAEEFQAICLGEIADFEMGQAPPGNECNKEGVGTLFVKAGEFGELYPDEKEWTTKPLKHGKNGDVFICVVGATAGKLNLGINCAIGRSVAAIRPKNGFDTRFIYYQLQPWVLKLRAASTGSAQGVISKNQLASIPFKIVSYPQQQRIVAKIEELFSHIDAGIDALKKAKQLLKQYRQSVLKAAVTGELTKEWREANKDKLEPASKLLERILKERRQKWEEQQLEEFKAKGKVPKDEKWKEKYLEPKAFNGDGYEIADSWIMARAEQVCDFITKGTTPPKDKLNALTGDIPFIKVYNLTFNTSLNFNIDPTFTDIETHNGFLARSKVYPGDVLMNIVGPPLGKVSIVSELHNEWNINQAIAAYRPISGLHNKLLAYFLLSKPIVEWMLSKTKTTAGQVNLTLEISRDAPIPIIPEAEQTEIVRLIENKLTASDRMLMDLERQLIKAEKNKQSILASAFSGSLVGNI